MRPGASLEGRQGVDTPPGPLDREQLLALSDLTLADYLRYLARYGGEVEDAAGLLLFAGAHPQPNPYRNGVLRIDDALSAEEVLARADAFFGPRRRSYALWVREHGDGDLERLARDTGMRELERLPQLVLRELPEYVAPPEGVELRRADDERTREDYLGLVANAWAMADLPRAIAARVFFDPESLADPGAVPFVAYFDELPVSAAMTYVSRDVALSCQGATIRRPAPGQALPRTRTEGPSRSLAACCCWEALKASFDEHGVAVALGQTSRLGAPVWAGLGFRPISSYARYVVPTPRVTLTVA